MKTLNQFINERKQPLVGNAKYVFSGLFNDDSVAVQSFETFDEIEKFLYSSSNIEKDDIKELIDNSRGLKKDECFTQKDA